MVIDRPITVMSVIGEPQPVILGAVDPDFTFGPGAVRCAVVANGGVLHGFAVAGEDRKFVWADAKIDTTRGKGVSADTVVVSSRRVPKPVAVRYGWADNPDCTLFNDAGLPASPFRTDRWPVSA